MNYYYFSFDADTSVKTPTKSDDVEEKLCGLEPNGYTIYKVDVSTSYIITHGSGKYAELEERLQSFINESDRWILIKVAVDRMGEPRTTDPGIVLCSP